MHNPKHSGHIGLEESHRPAWPNHHPTYLPLRETTRVHKMAFSPERTMSNGLSRPRDVEPIAVCGIGLRLPGGVRSGDDFWRLLVEGRDARDEIPAARFSADGFAASLGAKQAMPTRHGYFLQDDLSRLDTSFFSMSKKEAERCDPQQRLLLEVVRECLEDAGETDYRGRPIGCYVGTFAHDWYEMTTKDMLGAGSYSLLGASDLLLANRVSYEFDLHGPSAVVKTGCSASLVALHDACRALQSRDASGAVVCGTSLLLTPTTSVVFFSEGILSPDASCKTFDAAANGYARAEGITAVYVKRLSDALRDGNPIRAVIRNTGSNCDGRSQGLTCPSGEAQEALMRQVYGQAGLDPAETAFVECHGTGTATGDPIETRAVGNVFGDKGVYIGSVKPNVGHSEGCSGLTGLIKAVLALEKGVIPPNIKFRNPNPKIPFKEKKLTVPLQPTPFPQDRAERVSVNSFGIGGSNAHAVLESTSHYFQAAPSTIESFGVENAAAHRHGASTIPRPELFLFSANTPGSLDRRIAAFLEPTARYPDLARDIGYTLAVHREALPHRAFAIVQDGAMVQVSPPAKAPHAAPAIAMVFGGQGAQWPQMGRELVLADPAFRQDMTRMDEVLQGLRIPPRWSILEELLKPAETSRIHRAELSQPLTTALQLALVRYFRRLGITPAAVVGHSSGEIAAAYAAGHISLEFAIAAAYYRGYVASRAPAGIGAMAAVGLGAAEVARFLHPGACVACENSPTSTTISGDAEAVHKTLASILAEHPDVLARPLNVDTAYHSHHMAELSAEYLDLLQEEETLKLCYLPPDGPRGAAFYSSVTTRAVGLEGSPLASPCYWVVNLVSPVRFRDAVRNLLRDQASADALLLEVGPHSALAGPLRQICEAAGRPCNYASAQARGKDCLASVLCALGRLYQQAVPVDWKPLFGGGGSNRALAGLPAYPWDHSAGPLWHETRLSRDWRMRRFPDHCLLGGRVVESPDTAPLWRNVLSLDNVPWLADHKVRSDIVFPLAGYAAMAGEAVRQIQPAAGGMGSGGGGSEESGDAGYRLRHVVARAALVLAEAEAVEMVTSLRPHRLTDAEDSAEWYEFAIASYNGSAWVKHCEGQVALLDPRERPPRRSAVMEAAAAAAAAAAAEPDSLPRLVKTNRLYDAVGRMGLVFGPEFRRLADIRTSATGDGIARAKLAVPEPEEANPYPGPVHPASLDACIQMLLVASVRGLCRDLRRLVVPTVIESIEVSGAARGKTSVRLEAFCPTQGGLSSAEVVGFLADGADDADDEDDDRGVCLRMAGLQLAVLDGDGGDEEKAASPDSGPVDIHAAAQLHWLPDFDLTPLDKSLVRPAVANLDDRALTERLALLCILDSADRLAGLAPSQPHFLKYRAWLDREAARARSGDYPLVPDATALAALDPPARRELMEAVYDQLVGPRPEAAEGTPGGTGGETGGKGTRSQTAAVAQAIKRICDHAEAVFTAPATSAAAAAAAADASSDPEAPCAAGIDGADERQGGGGGAASGDVLNLLLGDGLLTAIYGDDDVGLFDFGPLLRRLTHSRAGRLNILEVGAGTGGTTACLLPHLFVTGDGDEAAAGPRSEGLLPAYSSYVFTDISAGFFPAARERFGWAPNMRYAALDISRDPAAQGFAPGSFDVVVAPNVVHATPRLRETLAHLRTLLRDDGVLMLTELWTEARSFGFVFGNFAGWWLGEDDGREWEPWAAPGRWDQDLRAAGFRGAEVVVEDAEQPWQAAFVLLARAAPGRRAGEESKRSVTLLCQDPAGGPAASLRAGLASEGWDVAPYRLGHDGPLPSGQDIISCLDLESRFFDHDTLTSEAFSAFQAAIRQLRQRSERILWLSPPYQVRCRDPRGAQALGVLRTLRSELNLPLFSLELEYDGEAKTARLISDVFLNKVQRARDQDLLNADREFAVDGDGAVLVGRYRPFSLARAQEARLLLSAGKTAAVSSAPDATFKTVQLRRVGDLSSLAWVDAPLPADVPPGHVEVRVLASGLNFRDVLLATGVLREPGSSPASNLSLGFEAAGVITRVGGGGAAENANHLRPGDHVVLLTLACTLATRVVVPAALVAPLGRHAGGSTTTTPVPERPLLNALAGTPGCYVTALWALLDAGRLRPGMSVLIHSAAGGVGLAALEVCRWVGGVDVYATVGNRDKAELLAARYPGLVRRERVFSSRDPGGFRDGVLRQTRGRGVDLVLNSLAGEGLHASWDCVARHGTLLELGKRDALGSGRLDMAPFHGSRSYVSLDLFQHMRDRPGKTGEWLRRYVDMFERGLLPVLDPVAYFDAGRGVERAFRHLQNGAHVGKVVVVMPDDPGSIPSRPASDGPPALLDPEAAYLLVGGAGGLGGSVASWLAEQGARHLTILSRSAGLSAESRALRRELEAMGCSVAAVAGSVESDKDVADAVSRSGRPVKGVFHLAMTLADAPFADLTWAEWESAVGPKARGAWALHRALAGQPLDFFWLASSIVTVVDEPGQANYSAGCLFLEAFCQYRRSLGLPATVLNICPISGVGYVAENPHARRSAKAQGICMLSESEFLDFVRFSLSSPAQAGREPAADGGRPDGVRGWKNPDQVVMGLRSASDVPLSHPDNRTNWRRDRRMGLYHNLGPAAGDDAASSGRPSKANGLGSFLGALLSADAATAAGLLRDPDKIAFLARETGRRIYELMMRPASAAAAADDHDHNRDGHDDGDDDDDGSVDIRLTLAQIGLDSLMAIELRRWLRGTFGISITVLEIVGSGTLRQLGETIAGKLAERLAKEP
ncbi:hypothetical protein VTJ83DRAFT_2930 [Remersonia thermophila]|uniref:Polyketide synthase n=1 Tax=Remersonia thermophila TaxID=72144 RepID=A0ABR4DDJ4_9PEZI